MMVACQKPFESSKETDQHYKLLVNDPDSFWKIHSKNKPAGLGYFSPEFRDLITRMLCVYPCDKDGTYPESRISMIEIIQHSWFNGEIYTE